MCRIDEKARDAWGCEKPSVEPQYTLDWCTGCDGDNAACAACHGTGREDVYRCPVFAFAEVIEFMTPYGLYQKGYLPEAGGWTNQPNVFIEACVYLDDQIARLRSKGKG